MAPAKKATARATPAPVGEPQVVAVHADWLANRQDWITTITSKFGEDVLTAAPLDVSNGAYIEALDPNVMKTVVNSPGTLGDGECIAAGCSFMAFDHSANQPPARADLQAAR